MTQVIRKHGWWYWLAGAGLLLLAVALTLVAFPVAGFWPAALVALTPLISCARTRNFNWRWFGLFWLAGTAFYVIGLNWLIHVTMPGWLGLSVYLGLYWAVFGWALRRLMMNLRWPAVWAAPLVWVTLEYLRSVIMTGFAWFLLGNALMPRLELVQIADLGGVWLVTGLCAAVAGCVSDVLHLPLRVKGQVNKEIFTTAATGLALLLLAGGYGWFRLQQDSLSPGPRVAAIQHYVPQGVRDDEQPRTLGEWIQQRKDLMLHPHVQLSRDAFDLHHPQLIVWSETMVPGYINPEFRNIPQPGDTRVDNALREVSRYSDDLLTKIATAYHSYLLVGASSREVSPPNMDGTPGPSLRYNVAAQYAPQQGLVMPLYAKRHRVPYGEYIPLANVGWIRSLLAKLSPYGDYDYTIQAGTDWHRFVMTADGHVYRYGVPICYEDVFPYVTRAFVDPQAGVKQVDFLVSISNDGWYQSPSQFMQHLQITQMRAVEARTGFVRAVNGGGSSLVDSCGRVLQIVDNDDDPSTPPVFGLNGIAAGNLPLDSRVSVYSQIGDLPIVGLGIMTILAVAWTLVRPRRAGPQLED